MAPWCDVDRRTLTNWLMPTVSRSSWTHRTPSAAAAAAAAATFAELVRKKRNVYSAPARQLSGAAYLPHFTEVNNRHCRLLRYGLAGCEFKDTLKTGTRLERWRWRCKYWKIQVYGKHKYIGLTVNILVQITVIVCFVSDCKTGL